ncbi:MAG: nitroreductase family deazaflavin-dependent oxidoreductase [Candidatus Bathyarchaeia archaeon]
MWYDRIIRWILGSPLHGLVSKNMMLITLTGRKSGKRYTVPVNYVREDDVFFVVSYRHRTWWRNLRGGAPVTVRVKGQELKAVGESIEDKEAVAAGLLAYLQKVPYYAKYFQVTLESDSQPNSEEVARAAQNRVMIRTN